MESLDQTLYLLFGARGQVGTRLHARLKTEKNARVLAFDREELDLSLPAQEANDCLSKLSAKINEELKKKLANVVTIMAAGYTHVDGCELTPHMCDQINITRTIDVLDWARQAWNSKLVFYSTDYVFDGESGPYAEEALMHPLSKYGLAKKVVENWLSNNVTNQITVRTTGVFDCSESSKNFVMQVLERLKNGQALQAVRDQFANPIWAKELADVTVDLIRADAKGIYHVAGGSWISRVDLAKTVASVFGFPKAEIHGIDTAKLNQPAKRPMRGGLVCDKAGALLNWTPPSVETMLKKASQNPVLAGTLKF